MKAFTATLTGNRYADRRHTRTRARALLMTATVTPPANAVARADPATRMRDYMDALEFYLELPASAIDRIVLVDNSGSSLAPLMEMVQAKEHDKTVELVSFAGNDHPEYGKTYGEFRLLDFALANSTLIASDDIFWKITGRLRFRNLAAMIAALPAEYDVACDLHNVPFVGTGQAFGNRYMELRAFSCRASAYDRLFRNSYEGLGWRFDWRHLYAVVLEARGQLDIIPRFPIQPLLEGVSGRHNTAYDSGLHRHKTRLRGYARKLAPWLWI